MNSAETMDVCAEAGYMDDAEGNVYNTQRPQVGAQPGGCVNLPTGVKIKGSVTIPAVPDQLREAAFISIPVTYKTTGEYKKGTIEIRSLKLDWK